eukprot:10149733-Lingulodinium_polyedra.AAC.1
MPEDRLATGDKPEDCHFPLRMGHPKHFSYTGWEGGGDQKGFHCDYCAKWADAYHAYGAQHRNRMRW